MTNASRCPQSGPSVISSSLPSRAQNILSYLILVGGIFTIPAMPCVIIASYTGLPFWDEWSVLQSLSSSSQPLPLRWFFLQDNEHRNLFARMLMLADIHFFHGRQVLLFVSMFVIQVGFLVTLAWLLRCAGGLRGAQWRAAVGLAAFCLFCPSQWEAFIWAWVVSFYVPGFFALLSLLSLVLYQRSGETQGGGWKYILLGLTVASIATYSNANGMLIWPILVGSAVALRLPPKVMGGYAIFGLWVSALYFIGYDSPKYHSQPLQSLGHLSTVAEYMAKYLGSSLPWSTPRISVPMGGGALLLAASLMAWTIARGYIRQPLPLILTGLMLFCLGTAFITALGRIGFGTDQAFSSRYQTWALLFWFCLWCLLLLVLEGAQTRAFATPLMAVIVVIMIIAGLHFKFPLRAAIERRAWQNAAAMALLTRVPDSETLAHTYPIAEVPWQESLYLRDRHLSVFSTDLYGQLGEPFATAYHTWPLSSCQGHVDEVKRIPDERTGSVGLRISGWTVDAHSRWPVRRVILTVDGRIAGFGGLGFKRTDVAAALHSRRALPSGWVGFARVPVNAKVLEVYGQLYGRGGTCEVAGVRLPAD